LPKNPKPKKNKKKSKEKRPHLCQRSPPTIFQNKNKIKNKASKMFQGARL